MILTRARAVAGVVLVALAAGCTSGGSGPAPGPSGTSVGSSSTAAPPTSPTAVPTSCRWGGDARLGRDRLLAVDSGTFTYKLVDARTLDVVKQCALGVSRPAGSLAEQRVTGRNPAHASSPTAEDYTWGVLRPGGASRTVVVGAAGVVDLLTGARVPVSVSGFDPAAVGRSAVIMVRRSALGSPAGLARAASWCAVPLTRPTACAPVAGATSPGTPVVDASGAVAWLPNAMAATRVPIAGATSGYLVRKAHGVATAVGVTARGGTILLGKALSPDGRSFVTASTLPATQRSATPEDPQVTWYGTDGTVHRSPTTWVRMGIVAGSVGPPIRDDVVSSADLRTLYVIIGFSADARRISLVAVPQTGPARRIGTVGDPNSATRLAFGDTLLTAPGPADASS